MNCKQALTIIHGYLDNELDLQASLEMESHIAGCENCRMQMLQLTNLRDSIRREMNYHPAPETLSLSLQQTTKVTDKNKSGFKQILPYWSQLKPTAAFIVIILAVSLSFHLQTATPLDTLTDEVVSGHIRSLMAEHLTDVASSDKHTVKPWFNGKLDFSPRVEDLTEQGFPLVGGRLDYLASRPVTALVYRRRQHLINVFIWPEHEHKIQGDYKTNRNGFNLLAFNTQGMNYWIVSDLNANELMELKKILNPP